MSKYWVGKLHDGRLLLFDEKIPQDDQDTVFLFDYSTKSINRFPRIHTRNNIIEIKDSNIIDIVVSSYLSKQDDINNKNNNSVGPTSQQRIIDPIFNTQYHEEGVFPNIEYVSFDDSLYPSSKLGNYDDEILEDMNRTGYYRPNLKTPDYEYSDDDLNGLEGDDYLDDYMND